MPLRKDLRGIGQRILDFYARGGEPPYLLYVYAPSDEWVVRRDLKDLQLWLEAPDQGVRCAAISLADLFWQALEAEGWIEELVNQEREAGTDESARRDIYRAVGEILRLPPSLPERVIAAVDELAGRAHRCVPVPSRSALPRVPHLDADRRPQESASPAGHAALSRRDRWRLRSEVHGPHRAGVRLPCPHRPPRRSSVKIRELFRGDIERPIETVIHVDLSDEAIVAHEIEEYVVTENIREHLEELVDVYADTARNPSESTNVWVSGFFGSGKSSFAKTVGYALANPVIEGRTATDRLLARANSHKLEALLNTAHTLAPTIAVFLDLASGRDMLREGESLVLPVYRAPAQAPRLLVQRAAGRARDHARRRRAGSRPSRRRCWRRPMARTWAQVRDVALAKNYASRALHLIDAANFPSADSWAKAATAPNIDHNWLAKRALELLGRRGERSDAPRLRRRRGWPVRRAKHPAHVRSPGPGGGVPEEARPALARGDVAGEAERRRRQPRVAPGRVRPGPGPLPAPRRSPAERHPRGHQPARTRQDRRRTDRSSASGSPLIAIS